MKLSRFWPLVVGSAAVGILASSASPVQALMVMVGTPITGSLLFGGNSTNFYSPTNGFVPTGQGYLNASDQNNSATVPLSETATEFGFVDSSNTNTADFTTIGLTIQNITNGNSISYQQIFVSSAFTGLSINKIADTFLNAGVTASLIDDTITIGIPGFNNTPGTFTASFEFSNATPVPFDIPGGATIPTVGSLFALALMRKARKKMALKARKAVVTVS
ncbi:hypothetical protein [Nodularia chucula]|uniref:hypothetical protein n=1 Tax=Nodularia chucula TaxID=3093667 RepID=UPI0039C6C260